ncbi:hypothetical protein ACGTNG_12700 [Halomonas sp. 1390]|uniref:hypothetical protein n=1 Tax=Halomonas sp. B23F22_3 TaxID=3459516 RepID=UPI00373E1022
MKYDDSDYEQVTGSDFHNFLIEKGISLNCPACENDNVAIMADAADGPVQTIFMTINSPPRLAGREVPFMSLTCRNCGFVRHFQAGNVLDWLKEESRNG